MNREVTSTIGTVLCIGVFGAILGASIMESIHDHGPQERPFYVLEEDFPIIGSEAYTESCRLFYVHEDGSAMAICEEDGAFYYHDPDGMHEGGTPEPGKEAGWYASGMIRVPDNGCPPGQINYGPIHGCLPPTG